MRKNFLTVVGLLAVAALVFAGCGKEQVPEATQTAPAAMYTEATVPAVPELTACTLTTATWSSPNGATVYLNAVPNRYDQSYTASFVVRLEGENVAENVCQWDGKAYTASAELNAADGLCYYVLLTDAQGVATEIPVNTPNMPTDEHLINLASALESYCTVMVEGSSFAEGQLTIETGSVQVQVPKITNEGETITVTQAVLVLTVGGRELGSQKLTLENGETLGSYQASLSGTRFEIPELEDEQQLLLNLNVTLSNGQFLSAPGGSFTYTNGEMLTTVG